MKVNEHHRQRKIRRKASDALLVYDIISNQPIGQILDLSAQGMKLMTEEPVDVLKIYYCKLQLPHKINGKSIAIFDAECRWCKLNEETTWYNSGYKLRFTNDVDAELVQRLIHKWMVDRVKKFNNQEPIEKKQGLLAKIFSK